MGKFKKITAKCGVFLQIIVLAAGGAVAYSGSLAAADDGDGDPATVPLSGIVTAPGGQRIGDNTWVNVTMPGDDASVAVAVASVSGQPQGELGVYRPGFYELDVAPGTYDVHFMTNNNDIWPPVVYSNVTISGPTVLNAEMTSPLPLHQLSGRVTTADNQPIPHAWVYAASEEVGLYALTDEDGNYSMLLPPSDQMVTQNLAVMDDDIATNSAMGLPQHFLLRVADSSLTMTADTVKNFQLPSVNTITVNVLDRDGNAAPGQYVTLDEGGYSEPISNNSWLAQEDDVLTDANGQARLLSWNEPNNTIGGQVSCAVEVEFSDDYQLCPDTRAYSMGQDQSITVSQTDAILQLVATPTDFTATTNADGTVTFSWTPIDGASAYEVFRDGLDYPGNVISDGSATGWTDQFPVSGTHNYYVVAVKRHVGESGPSPILWATTP